MLRKAGLDDLRDLHRIERKCFGRRGFSKAHIVWTLRNPRAEAYLYDVDGKPVGTVMVRREGETTRVISIGVLPKHRRKGIGRALMAKAEEVARKAGTPSVSLEVSVNNEGAIAFYRDLGYEVDGLLRGYYSWGEDAHRMTKALPGEGL